MKIALNLQPAVTQQAGIGRYTRELATHLIPQMSPDMHLRMDFFDFRREATIPPSLQQHPGLHPVRWMPGGIMQKSWNQLAFPPYEWIYGKADLFHFPNFLVPPCNKGKTIVSIHDVSFIRYPQYTEPRNLKHLTRGITRTAQRADAIITISKFSAEEIVTFLNVPREKVFPIHLGIGPEFTRPTQSEIERFRTRTGIYRPYLLTVGTVEPRKNLNFLIQLFEQLKDFQGDLIIAGGLGWHYEAILERIKQSPRAKDIRRIGYIPDHELPSLYAGAEICIVPSFYEGFGFPPLEAMACGTPVAASTGGSLAEILQDGAILHDHFNLEKWKYSVLSILSDAALRLELAERGIRVASQYTWEKTATETLNVYRNTLA